MTDRTEVIIVNRRPLLSSTLPGLNTKPIPELVDQQSNTISEVGSCTVPFWFGDAIGYPLREPGKGTVLTRFGRAFSKHGMSTPTDGSVLVPAVGSDIVLQPMISRFTDWFLRLGKAYRYDMAIHLYLPLPLGASFLIELTCPEIDETTRPKGVIWRPTVDPGISLLIPYRCEKPIFENAPPATFAGMALRIRTIFANCEEQAQGPFTIYYTMYPHNIEVFDWDFGTLNIENTKMNFKPISAPKESVRSWETTVDLFAPRQEQMDGEPVTAIASAVEINDPALVTPTPAVIPAEDVTPVRAIGKDGEAAGPRTLVDGRQDNAKWVLIGTYKFDSQGLKSVDVTVEPGKLPKKGQTLASAFRRHVWCAGTLINGRMAGLEFKIKSDRSPAIGGLFKIYAMYTSTRGDFEYHTLGGADTTIYDYPGVYAYASGTKDKNTIVSPWHRTSTAINYIRIEPVVLNTTQDVQTCTVAVYARMGGYKFQNPIKPGPAPKTLDAPTTKLPSTFTANSAVALFNRFTTAKVQNWSDGIVETDAEEQADDGPSNDALTTYPAQVIADLGDASVKTNSETPLVISGVDDGGYRGIMLDDQQGESTDAVPLNGMWSKIWSGKVKAGETKVLTFNPTTIYDLNANSGNAPIGEQLSRFAEFKATGRSAFGPAIGKLRIRAHLPADSSADIEYVALPADMAVETAMRFFGLDSILGMAGSAVSSIGGSILNGALNTVGGIFNGVSNIFGGSSGPSQAPASDPPQGTTMEMPIPTDKFVNFLKPILGLDDVNLDFNLILKIVDLLGPLLLREGGEVPITVYAQFDGLEGLRACWERTVTNYEPKAQTTRIIVNQAEFGEFMVRVASTTSNVELRDELISKALHVIATRSLEDFRYDLTQLRQEPKVSEEEFRELTFRAELFG